MGELVGRYVRWLRNEWGATDSTVRDYEAVLARMSLTLADREPLTVTVDDLRDVIDLWADRQARTRGKVTSIIRSFWSWAEEHDQVPFSPAAKLRRPRAPRRTAPLLPHDASPRLLTAAVRQRDRVALVMLLDLGLRRTEVTGIRVGDIDLARRTLDGLRQGPEVSSAAAARSRRARAGGVHADAAGACRIGTPGAERLLALPGEAHGAGGRLLAAYPKRRLSTTAMHRWWYARLADADLVARRRYGGDEHASSAAHFAVRGAASCRGNRRSVAGAGSFRSQHDTFESARPQRRGLIWNGRWRRLRDRVEADARLPWECARAEAQETLPLRIGRYRGGRSLSAR